MRRSTILLEREDLWRSHADLGRNWTATLEIHKDPNPNSAYKQLFVKGTRLRARVLYGLYACGQPMTREEIAEDYDLLSRRSKSPLSTMSLTHGSCSKTTGAKRR